MTIRTAIEGAERLAAYSRQIVEIRNEAERQETERLAEYRAGLAAAHDQITRAQQARLGGVSKEEEQAAQLTLWAALWATVPAPLRTAFLTARAAHEAAQGQAARSAQALAATQADTPDTPAGVPAWSARVGALTAECSAYRKIAETASARYMDLRDQVNEALRAEAHKRAAAAVALFDQGRAAFRQERAALYARRAAAGRVQRRAQVVSLAVRTGGVSAVPAVILEGSPDETPKKRR